MPRMAIRRYTRSPIFYGPLQPPLTRLLSSMEGIWCQGGNTLLSVSCTLTERNIKVFYVVVEAGLEMFRSSCLLAMDSKTGTPSVMEAFVWDVLRADSVLVHMIYSIVAGASFPKDTCQTLCCGRC